MPNLKVFLSSLLPGWLHPYVLAQRMILRSCDGGVLSGPFARMGYVSRSVGSAYEPKLLGIYEMELWEDIESLCSEDFSTIIDVGAAEGYYAVGMARRCPTAQVIAFESQEEGRNLLQALAAENGVEGRISIRGHCEPDDLAEVLHSSSKTLIIMDVEGAEESLLRPDLIPQLTGCHILVETHDFALPGVTDRLRSRFSLSHQVHEFQARERNFGDLPVRSWLLDRWLLKHTREFRPPGMKWLLMEPRTAS